MITPGINRITKAYREKSKSTSGYWVCGSLLSRVAVCGGPGAAATPLSRLRLLNRRSSVRWQMNYFRENPPHKHTVRTEGEPVRTERLFSGYSSTNWFAFIIFVRLIWRWYIVDTKLILYWSFTGKTKHDKITLTEEDGEVYISLLLYYYYKEYSYYCSRGIILYDLPCLE